MHTNLGDLKIELFCESSPKTCENFLGLAACGYYDNTKFHRNIPEFIIQGNFNFELKVVNFNKLIYKEV